MTSSPGLSRAMHALYSAPVDPPVTTSCVSGLIVRPEKRSSFRAIACRNSAKPICAVYVFQPSLIAACAARRTCSGTGVSQMPCDRLIPPARSHSRDMFRISERTTQAERSLSENGIDPFLLTDVASGKELTNRLGGDLNILGRRLRIQGKRQDLAADRFRFG